MTRHKTALIARWTAVLAVGVLGALLCSGCSHHGSPGSGYASAPITGGPHLNIIQRHPTMAGIAAGVATRQLLKASAERKKERGEQLNFAERHPTLTGIAAGVATHHLIKHFTPRQ